MKSATAVLVMSVFGLFSIACHKDEVHENLSQRDIDFVNTAAIAIRGEIELDKLAVQKGSNPAVSAFGIKMRDEHGGAWDELNDISRHFAYTPPNTPDSTHIFIMHRLMSLSGRAFDSLYMDVQVKDHQEALLLFQDEASNGDSEQFRNYAAKYMQQTQEHLILADSIKNLP